MSKDENMFQNFGTRSILTSVAVTRFQDIYRLLNAILYTQLNTDYKQGDVILDVPLAELKTPPQEDLSSLAAVITHRESLRAQFRRRGISLVARTLILMTNSEELQECAITVSGRCRAKAVLEPLIVQSYGQKLHMRSVLHPFLVRQCSHLLSALGIELLEEKCLLAWKSNRMVNLEKYLTSTTALFKKVTGIPDLEVLTAK